VKNFRHQHQRPKKNTLVIGRQAIVDALKTGKQLDRIYMQTAVHGSFIDEIKTLALQHNVPINNVPAEKLNNFNVFNHEGCVAQISKIQYQNLQDVISFIVENGEVPLFIILDGKGNRIHTQNSEYLENGKKSYDAEKVLNFLQQWSPKALDPKLYSK
jgi:23S rRNA (guanosine2251-2'-O)-methyltransferase